jgi:hypothetical protein
MTITTCYQYVKNAIISLMQNKKAGNINATSSKTPQKQKTLKTLFIKD